MRVLFVFLLLASFHLSADTLEIQISGVEDQHLSNVQGYLPLFPFQNQDLPSTARIHYLHKQSAEKIQQSLHPFGFYRAKVQSELEKQGDVWKASYAIDKGDEIRLTEVDIQLLGDGNVDIAYQRAISESGLKVGEILEHANYTKLKNTLSALAAERGYFDAKLVTHKIQINLEQYHASIRLHFDTGERYKLGEVRFKQDKPWLSEDFLGRYVEIEPKEPFIASKLQQLQSDLSNSTYYKQVQLDTNVSKAVDKTIPVDVELQANTPRQTVFGFGYGTDTGLRLKGGITGRRVNQYGHSYKTELLISEITYAVAGEYIIPGADPRTDSYGIRASYEDEHSDNLQYKALNLGTYYRYRSGLWMKTTAIDYHVEEFELEDDEDIVTLLIPSVNWTRTFPAEMEKRVYPEHGTWLKLFLRGGHESFLSDTSFIQPQISAKWITSFRNKSRFILRGSLAATWVDDYDLLPFSLRYFSGGDKSLRGYDYGIVAPSSDGDVYGGKYLQEISAEYEIPFADKWSVALFADVGDAYDDKPDYKSGVGFGIHWRSPIGPIRLDIAHALNNPPGDEVKLHLTIGPDL